MKLVIQVLAACIVFNGVYSAREKLDSLKESRLSNVISFKEFPRYDKITAYLESLSLKYNEIAKTFILGKSFENRDILGIKISNSPDITKKSIIIDAGIHAREWIAPTTALYIIHELIENENNHNMFKDVDIYVIPSLNPDGYEYTHQNKSTRLWRKTRSVQPNVSCIGVDANRNFDIAWMTIGASSDPCENKYAGPKAFSEPEAAALRDFILALNGSAKTYITLHSCGNLILHPWGYTAEAPKSVKTLKCVADAAAAEIFKIRKSTYRTGSSNEILYPLSGGSRDWVMAKGGVDLSYTIELTKAKYSFEPPPSEIIPVGREIFEAFKVIVNHTVGYSSC